MTEKQTLRKNYKALRDSMSAAEVNEKSAVICRNFLSSDLYQNADRIYAYYPLGNEVDVTSIIKAAWKEGKAVAFPKVFGDEMRFFETDSFAALSPGCFGVMEPEETFPVFWRDALVLTPGVAFDVFRNRMGYGKGYYDRYFEQLPSCRMAGFAYGLQICEKLPAEPHDRKLDVIFTEKGCLPDLFRFV